MVTIVRMSIDIFPNVDIPVVTVIWSFTVFPPDDIEKRVVTFSERAFTTTVNDIEHMAITCTESPSSKCSLSDAKIEMAVAQITSIAQTLARPAAVWAAADHPL